MSTTLVACPLGPKCLSGVKEGHKPGSAELAICQASAAGTPGTDTASVANYDPSAAYRHTTDEMQRLHKRIKRAWGADGRGIPNLIGPPGIGKSEMVENLALQMNADFMIFDVSSEDPDVLNGIPYNPTDEEVKDGGLDGKGRIRIAGRLYDRSIAQMFYRDPDKPLVVFLDEINGGKEALLSSLQKVMTSRTLPQEGVALNDNVFLVAAMNDAEHTSNGNDLSAAQVSRLTPIHVKPNLEEWINGEMTFWGKGFNKERMEEVASVLGEKAPTADQYLEAVTHVAGYLETYGNAYKDSSSKDRSTINIFSQPLDEDDLTQKVGQPRSWSKAINGIAMAIANRPEGYSVHEDARDFREIIQDNCGSTAALNFTAYYETHRELPDMNNALEKGTFGDERKNWKAQGRTDIPMFAMSVIANADIKDIESVGRAMDLFAEVAEDFPDLAASRFQPAVKNWVSRFNEMYGNGSPESKALSGMLLEKINSGGAALKESLSSREHRATMARGRQTAEEAAISAARSAAERAGQNS